MPTSNLGSFVQLMDTLEGTGTAAWGWDVDANIIRWSDNAGPLFGFHRGYQPSSYEEFLSFVDPTDRPLVENAVEEAVARGVDYEFDIRVRWRDGTVRWLSARGHAVVEAGRTRRVVGVVSDATPRKRRNELDRFLAAAGEVLVSTLRFDEVLASVAEMLVRSIADWCSVQLLTPDGLEAQIVTHRDPARVALAERLMVEYPPDPEPSELVAGVLDTGRAVLLEEITDDLLERSARDERHLELLRSLGLHSAITAPIKARGVVLGVMSIVSAESSHRFGDEDVEFAEEFGRRAGMALDNARLMSQTQAAQRAAERNSERLAVLTAVVARLSGASDISGVATAAIQGGVAALGADRGAVVLRQSGRPRIVASTGYDESTLVDYAGMIDEPGPLSEAMRSGRPVYCESFQELIERYPNLAGVNAGGESSFAAIPLAPFGQVTGAMGLVFQYHRSFDDDDRTLLSALGLHIGVAIERSKLYEESHTVATTLQRALAPPPVEDLAGLHAAARYEPAGAGEIGGDWYDIVRTPRGTLCFIVGDVVGRGLEAVATMAQLRHSSRLLLLEGRTAGQAMHSLDLLARAEQKMLGSTVLCVDLEPETNRATLVSLGHLPPFLVRAGSAEMLELPVNPPLGIGHVVVKEFELTLGQDEAMVLFTDGVVERRDEAIDESLETLRSALERLDPEPDLIAGTLVDRCEESEDDSTVLVIRPGSHDSD